MAKFLILVPLPKDQGQLGEAVVRSAVAFLEAQGKVERAGQSDQWQRPAGRNDAVPEVLTLVELRAASPAKDEFARAKTLEGVLRRTLASAGLRTPEVRVFVAEG